MGRHSMPEIPEPRQSPEDGFRARLLPPERWDWDRESGDLGARSLPAGRLPERCVCGRYRARHRLDDRVELAR